MVWQLLLPFGGFVSSTMAQIWHKGIDKCTPCSIMYSHRAVAGKAGKRRANGLQGVFGMPIGVVIDCLEK